MKISDQVSSIRAGLLLLVLCCAFYLVWWSITFNPMKKFPSLPKYLLFACMVISGAAGGMHLFTSLGKLPAVNRTVSGIVIALAGAAIYGILLFLTGHFLHRQVTTELFLIVGWAVLELCILTGLYGADALTMTYAVIMSVISLAAAAVSMVCYLLYYDLPPVTGFYDGMVPLILFAVVMAVQALHIK